MFQVENMCNVVVGIYDGNMDKHLYKLISVISRARSAEPCLDDRNSVREGEADARISLHPARAMGSFTVKVLPFPTVLSTSMVPP